MTSKVQPAADYWINHWPRKPGHKVVSFNKERFTSLSEENYFEWIIRQLLNSAFVGYEEFCRSRYRCSAEARWTCGARFSKALKTFRAREAIFSSSVSKNGEVYMPETSCVKRTSLHIKNMWIQQLCNRKMRDFAIALRARKASRAFEKRAPGQEQQNWSCVIKATNWESIGTSVRRFTSLQCSNTTWGL